MNRMDYINTFDWKFYVEKYPDLGKCGINTPEKALKHYTRFGIAEGRIPHAPLLKNPVKPEPTVIQPTVIQPTVIQPTVIQPTVTEPTVTEPTVIQPTVVEPTVVEPEPTVVEPEPTVVEPVQEIELNIETVTVTEPTVTEPIELTIDDTSKVKKPRATRRKKTEI